TPPHRPSIRFLFVRSGVCRRLPPHPASRRRSCPWLAIPVVTARRGLPPPTSAPCQAHRTKSAHFVNLIWRDLLLASKPLSSACSGSDALDACREPPARKLSQLLLKTAPKLGCVDFLGHWGSLTQRAYDEIVAAVVGGRIADRAQNWWMVTKEAEEPGTAAGLQAFQQPSEHGIGMDQVLTIDFGFLKKPRQTSGSPGPVVFHRHGEEEAGVSDLLELP